jgi:hypothetical protein
MEETKPVGPLDEYPLCPAEPQEMPEPTFWPIIAALGVIFIFWGVVASPIISFIGMIVFGISIAGWIQDLRYE